jgi:hypothetical protein
MRKTIPLLMTALAIATSAAIAQTPPVDRTVVASSAPGKASVQSLSEITASVVAVDKATRTVTLKGPKGNDMDVVAGEAVRNFDQIKVGDIVIAQYAEALTLELKKSKGTPSSKEATGALRAKPGDKPGGIVGREVTVLADVVAVDPAASTISLKGPKGRVVELKVRNPEQFKVVKVGDQVEAVYTEAIAVAVAPAPAKK